MIPLYEYSLRFKFISRFNFFDISIFAMYLDIYYNYVNGLTRSLPLATPHSLLRRSSSQSRISPIRTQIRAPHNRIYLSMVAAPSHLGKPALYLCNPSHLSTPAVILAPAATHSGAPSRTVSKAASSLSSLAAPFFPRDRSAGRPKAFHWFVDVYCGSDCDFDASLETATHLGDASRQSSSLLARADPPSPVGGGCSSPTTPAVLRTSIALPRTLSHDGPS